MKTKIIIIAAAFISSAWTTPSTESLRLPDNKTENVKAKQNQSFAFFRTHRQGRGITATWGMISTSGITDFSIQRTYEDPNDIYSNWIEVCTMSCNNSRSFKVTDTNVLPGTISYRIVAMNGFTPVDVSDISTERIVQH